VSGTFVAGLPFDDSVIPKVFDFDDGNTLFPDNLHILQRSLRMPPLSFNSLDKSTRPTNLLLLSHA
jgi:hypothetical protein